MNTPETEAMADVAEQQEQAAAEEASASEQAAAAVASIEERLREEQAKQAQPEEASIDALAQLTLTFMADGGIHMAIAGDLRPSIAWALGDFLRSVGDDMFQAAKQEAVAKLQAKQQQAQRIVVPQSGLTRIPR